MRPSTKMSAATRSNSPLIRTSFTTRATPTTNAARAPRSRSPSRAESATVRRNRPAATTRIGRTSQIGWICVAIQTTTMNEIGTASG
jgi:hypothetical protein